MIDLLLHILFSFFKNLLYVIFINNFKHFYVLIIKIYIYININNNFEYNVIILEQLLIIIIIIINFLYFPIDRSALEVGDSSVFQSRAALRQLNIVDELTYKWITDCLNWF